jgi:hypothetical protein
MTLNAVAPYPPDPNHPAARSPHRYRQRIYELMHKYHCYEFEAAEIAEVEYRELGHIPKPQTDEIPHY